LLSTGGFLAFNHRPSRLVPLLPDLERLLRLHGHDLPGLEGLQLGGLL
jgi:hypothetical protein